LDESTEMYIKALRITTATCFCSHKHKDLRIGLQNSEGVGLKTGVIVFNLRLGDEVNSRILNIDPNEKDTRSVVVLRKEQVVEIATRVDDRFRVLCFVIIASFGAAAELEDVGVAVGVEKSVESSALPYSSMKATFVPLAAHEVVGSSIFTAVPCLQ